MVPDQNMNQDFELLLQDTIAALSEGIAIFDAEANLTLVNDSFCGMNRDIAEFLRPGLRWDIYLREAENRGVLTLDARRGLETIEADLLDGIDTDHSVQVNLNSSKAHLFRIKPTSDGGFILSQTEVVDYSAQADAAREAEVLLSKVLEACPTSLTMSRVGDGKIIYRSPAARALLGSNKSCFSHFSKREERADFVTALLPDARVDDMRVTGVRADGTEFPAAISARLIDYRGEDMVVSSMDDLTDELAVQSELAQQRRQIFQAEKMSALGELLAGVAHELNNPLSIIVGNAEILKEDLEGTSQAGRIGKLGNAAERCVKIVRSFLSMARQEPLNPQPVSLRGIVETANDAMASVASVPRVRITTDLPGNLPRVMVDEVQLAQVLINLLTNSVHAIQDAGVGNAIVIKGQREAKSGMVCLTISDNGPGVDDDIAGRIFDPLFTTKEVGKGTGVGLAFCHKVIASHNGIIRLEPKTDGGATFSIRLPYLAD